MTVRASARKDVLVADGVDFYRRMLCELLLSQGYRVRPAEGAEDALGLLQAEAPDLLLLDLSLPPAGGRAFLEQAKASGAQRLRVVALSGGFHDDLEVERLRGLGVSSCVQRSAPVDDILVAARDALFPDSKDLRRSPRAQVHVPVSYRVEDEDGSVAADVATQTFNVSADGMFLVCTAIAPPPPGSKVQIRFWLPASPEVIQTEGVVVWCNQAGGRVNELYPPGMGVMFLGLTRGAAAVINHYVRERTVNPFR